MSLTLTEIEFDNPTLDLAHQPLDPPEQVHVRLTPALPAPRRLLEDYLQESSPEEADGLKQVREGAASPEGILSVLHSDNASLREKLGIVAGMGDILEHQSHKPPAEVALALPFTVVVTGHPPLLPQAFPGLSYGVVGPGRLALRRETAMLVFDHEAVQVRGDKTAVAAWGDEDVDCPLVSPAAKGGRVNPQPSAGLFEGEPLGMD